MSIYLKISRVRRDENLFIFFQNGNKNCRVGTKIRVGRVSGNTAILGPYSVTKLVKLCKKATVSASCKCCGLYSDPMVILDPRVYMTKT